MDGTLSLNLLHLSSVNIGYLGSGLALPSMKPVCLQFATASRLV